MKAWTSLALTIATAFATAQANAARATAPELNCAFQEPTLNIRLINPNLFVHQDTIGIYSYDKALIAPLLDKGEADLDIQKAQLFFAIKDGSCSIDKNSSTTIAKCHFKNDSRTALVRSSLNFEYNGKSASGEFQTVNVGRNLELSEITLEVNIVQKTDSLTKIVSNRAIATYTVEAVVGGTPRTVSGSQDVGEWTDATNRSDYDRCVVRNQDGAL